jgi:hypothetical protein
MAKQTFTTGQVLTAAQMTSLQQTAMGGGTAVVKTASYVLVAADAGTVIQMNSASATTITVNTSLFAAGDSVQIQNIGAGVMTITAGTATVNSAGTLGVTQYDGGFLYFSSASSAIWFDYTQAGTTLPLTTKGDLFGYDTGNARIPVGANDTVLTADSTQALGVKWATSASGGMTLISTTTLSGATTTLSSIPQTYNSLFLVVAGMTANTSNALFRLKPNDSTSISSYTQLNNSAIANYEATFVRLSDGDTLRTNANNVWAISIDNYTSTTRFKPLSVIGRYVNAASANFNHSVLGSIITNSAITSLVFDYEGTNTFAGGTILLYGVK